MPFISYAQNKEDVLLWRALKHITEGRYIDIGSWHPVMDSVTKGFYEIGWRGINIEPVKYYAELLRKDRPEDIVLEKVVSEKIGKIEFYEIEKSGLSTLNSDIARQHALNGKDVIAKDIETIQLNPESLKLSNRDIHWMKIDVEGAEFEVLKSWDSTNIRPWIIVIESINPLSQKKEKSKWRDILLNARYSFAYFDGLNDFYVSNEHSELIKSFDAPISIFDDYISFSEFNRHRELVNLKNEIVSMKESTSRFTSQMIRAKNRILYLKKRVVTSSNQFKGKFKFTSQMIRAKNRILYLKKRVVTSSNQFKGKFKEISTLQLSEYRFISLIIGPVLASKLKLFLLRHERVLKIIMLLGRKFRIRVIVKKLLGSKIFLIIIKFLFLCTILIRLFIPEIKTSKFKKIKRFIFFNNTPKIFRKKQKKSARIDRYVNRKFLEFCKKKAKISAWDDKLLELIVGGEKPWSIFNHELEIHISKTKLNRDKSNTHFNSMLIKKIIVDARCMSDLALSSRGVGVYGDSLIHSLLKYVGNHELVIIGHAEKFDQLIQKNFRFIDPELVDVREYTEPIVWFIQLSPMTSSSTQIAGLLHAPNVFKSVFIYDFIPLSYPQYYLPNKKVLDTYFARLKTLEKYDEFLFISKSTELDCKRFGLQAEKTNVVWPDYLLNTALPMPFNVLHNTTSLPKRMVLLSGDDPRKNIVMGLKMAEYALNLNLIDEVVVIGYSKNANYIESLKRQLNCDLEKISVSDYLNPVEFQDLLAKSSISVVCSFAEGLSLPVIESIKAGVPAVISRIPVHIELIGEGNWVGDPKSLKEMISAVEWTLKNRQTALDSQRSFFSKNNVQGINDYLDRKLSKGSEVSCAFSNRKRSLSGGKKRKLIIATPLPPQRTGIADHSAYWIKELAKLVDVTVLSHKKTNFIPNVFVHELDSAEWISNKYYARINILGNSHFHLQNIHLIPAQNTLAIAHDVRMTDLINSTPIFSPKPVRLIDTVHDSDSSNRHTLDEITDLKFGFISQFSSDVLFHSRKVASRVQAQHGLRTFYLPLIPYRLPIQGETWQEKYKKRNTLTRVLKIGFFGDADINTKSLDSIIESIMWLNDWGIKVRLRIIGNVNSVVKNKLEESFTRIELTNVEFTGYLDEESYKNEIGSIDIAIELRAAKLLGLSGSLADLVAFGVPCIVSEGLKEEMELPSYCISVGDDYSPLIVANKLDELIKSLSIFSNSTSMELERRHWIADRRPGSYASGVLNVIEEIGN
jgi:FkbM family methyltransferase